MGRFEIGSILLCGSCLSYFEIWHGYKDQGNDYGFGTCKPCQKGIVDQNEKDWDKAISALRDSLNRKNKSRFDALDRDVQKLITNDAIEDGLLVGSVRR